MYQVRNKDCLEHLMEDLNLTAKEKGIRELLRQRKTEQLEDVSIGITSEVKIRR